VTAPGVLTLLTDFGPGSVYVGQMHATFACLAPDVRVVDLAHDVPFGGVEAAAYVLARSWRRFPPGSVHVVVVDPGVGSDRDLLAVRRDGHAFVGPDNGVLAPVLDGALARRVENRGWMAEQVSDTFHGRDVLAPVAARLATGADWTHVGPPAEPTPSDLGPVVLEDGVEGRVILEDRFGNLVTNIPGALAEDVRRRTGSIRVRAGRGVVPGLFRTFSDVPDGEPLAYVGSGENLEIAVHRGSAAALLGVGAGASVLLEPGRR
jgi:S-adenosylmethionine hydrolase